MSARTKRPIIQVDCTIFYAKQIWYRAPIPHRVILSEAAPLAKNHAPPPIIAAQSNPAPSGAPAGGISIAPRHHIMPRTAKKAFPFEEKGCGGMVALRGSTRRFRPHPALARHLPPRRGRLLSAVRIFSVLLLNLAEKSALSLYFTERPWQPSPLRGKVARSDG